MEMAEPALERLLRSRDFNQAAVLAVETYGGELCGFLINLVGDESSAEDVFSQLGEDLWRGLPAFGFRSSVRTWLYVLARHAALRYLRSPWNRAGQRTGSSALDELVASQQSRTDPHCAPR